MKYFIIAILFVLSLGCAGCYLYSKRNDIDKPVPIKVASDASKKDKEKNLKSSNQINLPDYLTTKFWRNVTPEQLKEKLENIENVNEVRPDNKRNMLHLLVKHGQYPEMVSLLVDAGVDYNRKDSYLIKSRNIRHAATALHHAVVRKEKAYEFAKELLKYINVDADSEIYGASPLSWAAYERSGIEVIRLLLEKGADPNFQNVEEEEAGVPFLLGASILLVASVPNRYAKNSFIDPEVVQLLLDYKADITLKNIKGETAWDYMKENEEFTKTDLFKKLSTQAALDTSKKDKEKNLKSSNQINLPDHLTTKFWRNMTPEQLKEKLKNIENVNEVRLDNKRNMLHLLVKHGQHPEMVSLLINAGVDYHYKALKAPVSQDALRRKNKEKIYEFTRELLKYDINVDEPGGNYGITSLGLAVHRRLGIKVVRFLLEKGANPNHQLKASVENENDPHYLAASVLLLASMPNKFIQESFIDPEVIQLLLDYKADITLKNKEGKTAWDYMKENEEFTKTKLFKKLFTQFQ